MLVRQSLLTSVSVAMSLLIVLVGRPSKADPAPEKAADYALVVQGDKPSVAVGQTGHATVTIRPKAPWVLKTTTPFEVVVMPSAGLAVDKAKLTSKDFVDPKAADKVLSIAFTAKTKGAQRLGIGLNFFLCTEQVCQRYKDNAEYKVDVP